MKIADNRRKTRADLVSQRTAAAKVLAALQLEKARGRWRRPIWGQSSISRHSWVPTRDGPAMVRACRGLLARPSGGAAAPRRDVGNGDLPAGCPVTAYY